MIILSKIFLVIFILASLLFALRFISGYIKLTKISKELKANPNNGIAKFSYKLTEEAYADAMTAPLLVLITSGITSFLFWVLA